MPVNQQQTGPMVLPDNYVVGGAGPTPRGGSYGEWIVSRFGPTYQETVRRSNGFIYSQDASGVAGCPPAQRSTVTTGAFVVGQRYKIQTVGDTDFTLIGASANTVGVEFVATGVGGGTTGQARSMSACPMIFNPVGSGTYFIPTKVTWGLVSSPTTTVLAGLGLYTLANPVSQLSTTTSTGVIAFGTNDAVAPLPALVGAQTKSSSMIFQPVATLLTDTPTFVKSLGFTVLSNDLTSKSTMVYEADLASSFVLKPGYAMFIAPMAVIVAVSIISISGYEIPIPQGFTP